MQKIRNGLMIRTGKQAVKIGKLGKNQDYDFFTHTLLHEIKALQQITYLKLAWSFINVNPTKNAFFLTLINVTSA